MFAGVYLQYSILTHFDTHLITFAKAISSYPDLRQIYKGTASNVLNSPDAKVQSHGRLDAFII
ncbi:MAG: hypothetical protein WB392_08945 [Methanotrichaceae archaeon]